MANEKNQNKVKETKSKEILKDIPSNDVEFSCASCNTKYVLKSTLKEKIHPIDICAKCHPFYVGGNSNQQIRGRAEKFNKKMAKTETSTSSKKTNVENNDKVKNTNKKIIKSLNSL